MVQLIDAIAPTLTYLHAHLEQKETAVTKLKPYDRGKDEQFRPIVWGNCLSPLSQESWRLALEREAFWK